MRARLAWVFSISVAGVACGGGVDSPDGSAGSAGGGGDGGAGGEHPSLTVVFDPVTVLPGVENTQCVVKRVGNDEEIRVHEIHNVLPTGSHHLIVYPLCSQLF